MEKNFLTIDMIFLWKGFFPCHFVLKQGVLCQSKLNSQTFPLLLKFSRLAKNIEITLQNESCICKEIAE